MNWTGGNLHRQTKRAGTRKSAIANKQKQHFANARNSLQYSQQPPPSFRPSFMFQDGNGDYNTSTAARSKLHLLASDTLLNPPNRTSRSKGSHPRQSRLDKYENFAPVVNRLSSLGPRTNVRPSLMDFGVAPRRIEQGSRKSVKLVNDMPVIPDGRSHMFLGDGADTDCDGDFLGKQRRHLLLKQDWIGIDDSRPLHFDYLSVTGKGCVAKRRKPNGEDLSRHQLRKTGRLRVPSVGENYMMRGALPSNAYSGLDGSVQVRIGDAALQGQTTAESATQRSTMGTASSETMLLDGFEGVSDISGVGNDSIVENMSTGRQLGTKHFSESKSPFRQARTLTPSGADGQPLVIIIDEEHDQNVAHGLVPYDCSRHSSLVFDSEPRVEIEHQDTERIWQRIMDVDPQTRHAATFASPGTSNTGDLKDKATLAKTIFRAARSSPAAMRVSSIAPSATDDLCTIMGVNQRSHPGRIGVPSAEVPLPAEDPDAAWKAFVFGEGNGSDSEDLGQLDEIPVKRLIERDSSMIVEPTPTPRHSSEQGNHFHENGETSLNQRSILHRGSGSSFDAARPAYSVSSLDRPSSIADASMMGAVLFNDNKAAPRGRFGASLKDNKEAPLSTGQMADRSGFKSLESYDCVPSTFHRPKPFVNPMRARGSIPRIGERKFTSKAMLDAIEDSD